MNKRVTLFIQILFYGSLWGVLEASLGHVLHFIPATIAGSVMFPIAGAILYRAYRQTNSRQALVYIGVVAAMIKAVDFLLPAISVFKTINPMISILMESILVVAVIQLLISDKPLVQSSGIVIASVGWRTIFFGWMALQFALTGNLAPYLTSWSLAVNFLLLQGFLSAVLTLGLVDLTKRLKGSWNLSMRPTFASILLVLAVVVTYLW